MADSLKLLPVNNNPMVLGILQHAWSSPAQVTRASDPADVRLQAVDDSRPAGFATTPCRNGRPPATAPVSPKKDEEEDVLLDG